MLTGTAPRGTEFLVGSCFLSALVIRAVRRGGSPSTVWCPRQVGFHPWTTPYPGTLPYLCPVDSVGPGSV